MRILPVYTRLLFAGMLFFLGVHVQKAKGQGNRKFDFKPVQELSRQHGLPDPFLKPDGTRVASTSEWPKQREYIISVLEYYQYGNMPNTPKDAEVEEILSEEIYDGAALRKKYTLKIKRNGKSLKINFGLIKPVGNGPFPIIIKNDRKINDIADAINLEAVKRGYVMCQFVRTDLGSDNGELASDRNNGVFLLYSEYSWGTIAAWAWGYSLIIDYFATLNFIDMDKIVATGHSRGGKTAFCAGIFDDRIAITAPNSSGLGGTASHRYFELGMDEQTIGHASIKNPHWWTPAYFQLAGFETRIPFDAHFGKAVIAPRAFFNAHALQDYWANPFGTFLTFESAKVVYSWLGVEDNIKMHWRTGGHAQNDVDWLALLDFCDQYFFKKEVRSNFKLNPYPTIKIPVFWELPEVD